MHCKVKEFYVELVGRVGVEGKRVRVPSYEAGRELVVKLRRHRSVAQRYSCGRVAVEVQLRGRVLFREVQGMSLFDINYGGDTRMDAAFTECAERHEALRQAVLA